MEEDDDMLVVVIGDEDDDDIEWNSGKVCAPIQVKEEPFDADDVMQVIEAAQRYGRPINLRTDVFIDESDGDVTFEQAIHNIKIERYDTDDEVDHNAKDFDSIAEDFDHNAEDFDHSAEEFDHNAEDVDHNIEDFDNYLNNYGYEALDENNCDDPDYQVESDNDNYNSDFNSDLESVGGQSKKKKRVKMLSPSRQRSFVEDLRQQYPELERNQKALIKSLVEVMRSNKAPKPPKGFYILSDFMYECFKCGKMTNCIPAAERHYQEKHGPRYLVCYACGVDFRSKTNLYKHEKICQARDAMIVLKARALFLGRKGRSRPFIPDLRTVPVYKNKGFKRFPCTRCSATFTSKNNLVAHENMHRGVRPYCCDQCPSAYTSAAALTIENNLVAHENMHRGVRPYCCDQCPSAYTSAAALTRHLKKHSDEEYICDHCQRAFKVKAALIAHLDTHKAIPKYGCSLCPQRYATKNALNHHVRRVHLRLPLPCACQVCPKRYPRMSLLRDHMKKKHGLTLMTRKMFFKALPTMSEWELQQAKEILESDTPLINLSSDIHGL